MFTIPLPVPPPYTNRTATTMKIIRVKSTAIDTILAAGAATIPCGRCHATLASADTSCVFLFGGGGGGQHEAVKRLILHRGKEALHEAVILVFLEQSRVVVLLRILYTYVSKKTTKKCL